MTLEDSNTGVKCRSQNGLSARNGKDDKKQRPSRGFLVRLIFPESLRPSHIKITLLLFFAMFGNSLTLTMVFAYLPRLVRDFGIDEIHIGTFAGIVASSLFVGRTIGSYFWGMLTDRFGRKPTILVSNFLLAIFTLLFAFNWSFWWVTFARFMQGVVNGLVISAKAAVSDITDETNQAAVMGIVLSSFSFGLIIGPTVGGFLALPHERYPNTFSKDSVFGKYPYLLPNIVAFSLIVASLFFTYFYMPETLKRVKGTEKKPLLCQTSYPQSCSKDTNASDSSLKDKTQRCTNLLSSYEYSQLSEIFVVCSLQKGSRKIRTYVVRDPLVEAKDELIEQSEEKPEVLEITHSHFQPRSRSYFSRLLCCFSCCKRREESSFLQLIRIRNVRNIVLLYGFYSFVSIAYDELIPVYVATSRMNHGLSFTTADIGTLLLAQTVPNIVSMIFIAPKLCSLEVRFGGQKLYIFAIYFYAMAMPLIPCCSKLSNPASLWAVLIIILSAARSASALGFLAINIILNNSVEPRLLGAANGLGMAVSAFFRALSPATVGSLYTWSLQNEKIGFPLNYNFSFLALSFIAVMTLCLLVRIPKIAVNKRSPLTTSSEDSSMSEGQLTLPT